MRELKAICLEEKDVPDAAWPINSLATGAVFEACCAADFVVFRGRLVKNRFGRIDIVIGAKAPVVTPNV